MCSKEWYKMWNVMKIIRINGKIYIPYHLEDFKII